MTSASLCCLVLVACTTSFNALIHNPMSITRHTKLHAMEYPREGFFDPASKAQIPLKIAVAGGGVGGMFLGYALQKKGFEVTVYEKASAFSRFGGPIQLASNALSCVNSLSPDLFDEIMTRFTFTGTRKCGIKDGIRNTWYSVFEAITNLAEWNTLPYTGVIDRPDLQEILLDKIKPGTIINSMAVKSYVEHEGKNPYQCNLVQLKIPLERSHVFNTITDTADGTIDLNFEDGSEKKGFDLLVGADGIWSAIRAQMWGESTVKPGTCTYSGYTLFAAENVMEPASDFFADEGYFDAGYKVYIGPGKYFVTSDVGSGRIQWYAFLALPPGTKSRSSNLDYVKDQFKGWTNEIHACLDNTPGEIIEQRDLYDRRPSVTKSWSKGHVTMMGDAVHPMMPNLGQGGCQAIEDGFVLTDLLCSIDNKSQLKGVLQEYYRKRIVRSAIVQGMSRLSSDIIITSFSTPFKFSEFAKEGLKYKYLTLPSILTWYLKEFLPYIFYAQFGYLYSFAPSSFSKEKITKYVKDSLFRNKAEVQNVYDNLKDGYNTYFTAKTMQFMRYNIETKEITKIADAKQMRCKMEDDVCILPKLNKQVPAATAPSVASN